MSEIKSLVISSGEGLSRTPNEWVEFTQIGTFTQKIITASSDSKKVDTSAMVTGVPSIFARINLLNKALNTFEPNNKEGSTLNNYYGTLIDEWKGFLACIALDPSNISVERVELKYTEGEIDSTPNLYEPKGAFGNMLFEKKPLWCKQGLPEKDRIPFIDIIKYNGVVVGGTSPETFVFTSPGYKIGNSDAKFINNNKFADPIKNGIGSNDLVALYAYILHIEEKIKDFISYYIDKEVQNIKPDFGKLSETLQNWAKEIETIANEKLSKDNIPTTTKFNEPFDRILNCSTDLFGREGKISSIEHEGAVRFNSKDLLLPNTCEIAQIEFNDGDRDSMFLKDKPVCAMVATNKDNTNRYSYFALPLSTLGLRVFGNKIDALVGISGTASKAKLDAIYDPQNNNLSVTLTFQTEENSTPKILKENYKVGQTIKNRDLIVWPNFISSQWGRYFLYSEMPHNNSDDSRCPYRATPFVGDEVNDVFTILTDDDTLEPIYLSENGNICVPKNNSKGVEAKLLVNTKDWAAKYMYEIYESNKPYKGLRLTTGGKDTGFIIIRYTNSDSDKGIPKNYMSGNDGRSLIKADLGIDFGSTNTSVAYKTPDEPKAKGFEFTNHCVSLLNFENKETKSSIEKDIFYFSNKSLESNAVKSILSKHDNNRIIMSSDEISRVKMLEKEIKGGFPCFEKNLPVDSVTERNIKLRFSDEMEANLVQNMKWTCKEDDDIANKTAFLKSLMLQIYAELFTNEQGRKIIPTQLFWSYPSSMNGQLIKQYGDIWNSIKTVNPIIQVDGKELVIAEAPANKTNLNKDNLGLDVKDTEDDDILSMLDDDDDNLLESGGKSDLHTNKNQDDFDLDDIISGNSKTNDNHPSIIVKDEPIIFDNISFFNKDTHKPIAMTEACAVANFVSDDASTTDDIVLCFDIGGSTTDISVLCQINNKPTLIKQSSVRFAAQRITNAVKYSKKFKNVLQDICTQYDIKILRLNTKYNEETASFFFEQIVDRLNDTQLKDFYKRIFNNCPELVCVDLYVTGLLIFYAGQLTNIVVKKIRKIINDEAWKPNVTIRFAGKGSRIFDWLRNGDSEENSIKYYSKLFMEGLDKKEVKDLIAWRTVFDHGHFLEKKESDDVKYEVSKGLVNMTKSENDSLQVAENENTLEVLGEEGYRITNPEKELKFDTPLSPEMFEYLGWLFIAPKHLDAKSKFYKFIGTFYNQIYPLNLGITPEDINDGLMDMDMNKYIKKLQEYREEKEKSDKNNKFSFVAPIIILEGMKFYEDNLLKIIAKLN